jgi:hypothetical protein
MADTKLFKTTIYVDRDMYDALRIKLISSHLTFTDWVDKMLRKELGKSPKFSYETAMANPEADEK